jgi:hypothetical protein
MRDAPLNVCFLRSHSHGYPALQLLDATLIARMIRKYLGNLKLRASNPLHLLPKRDSFLRVVIGKRHQKHADMIRFRFLFSIERQREQTAASRLCPGNPLARMVGNGVGNFVGKHRRQLIVILNDSQQPRENPDLAAGQAECIDMPRLDHTILPFEWVVCHAKINLSLQRLDLHSLGDPPADALHLVEFRTTPQNRRLRQKLRIRCPPNFQFLLRPQRQRLRPMSRPFTLWRTPGHENGNDEQCPILPKYDRKCASRVQHGLVPYARCVPLRQYPAFAGPDGISSTQSKGRAAGSFPASLGSARTGAVAFSAVQRRRVSPKLALCPPRLSDSIMLSFKERSSQWHKFSFAD